MSKNQGCGLISIRIHHFCSIRIGINKAIESASNAVLPNPHSQHNVRRLFVAKFLEKNFKGKDTNNFYGIAVFLII
jgi:hypothetical protein